jgi:O-antigen/teichoic acid export membrane protein
MVGLGIGLYYAIGVDGILLGLGISFFPYAIRIAKEFKTSVIDFSLLKPRIGFMANSYILNIASAFNGSVDKLIIAPMVGFALLGNYQLGIQFLAVLHIIPSIVYKYILPQDAGGNPNTKLKQAIILISIGIAGLGIVLSPIVIPMAFPKFTESIQIIQIMSVSVVATTINLTYTSRFLGQEKIKIILVSSGIYIGILTLSIILLGRAFGINGMATALVLATFAETIFFYTVNKFKEKV